MLHIIPDLQNLGMPAADKMVPKDKATKKTMALLIVIAFFFLLMTGRLLYLQVFQFNWFNNLATLNYLRLDPIMAPRGQIYDRSGHLLVGNDAVYSVSLLYPDIKDQHQLANRLGPILGIPPAQIEAQIEKHKNANDLYLPIRIASNVNLSVVDKIEENKINLPGVILDVVPQRYYPYDSLAGQVLGYVGDITQAELDAHKNDGYQLDDKYGQAGLENYYQAYLRGVDGVREMEVNAQGTLIGEKGEKAPVPGDNLVLTLSARLEQVAQQSLAQAVQKAQKSGIANAKGGGVVMVDVHTGKVLVMASYPSFNPAVLSPNPPPGESTNIFTDPSHPFLNRALVAYPPGSTFKMVVATAGLEDKVITPDTKYYDPGYFKLGNHIFHNWYQPGFGYQNVLQAIQDSNDTFFWKLGSALGWSPIAQWADKFGLGQPTGIDLPGEETGVVPTPAYKEKTMKSYIDYLTSQKEKVLLTQCGGNKNSPAYQKADAKLKSDYMSYYSWDLHWQEYDTINMSIGQGYNMYTPLQLADYVATIANGGTLYRPYLVEKVISPGGQLIKQMQPQVERTLDISPDVLNTIHEGMGLVTQGNGTAAAVFAGFPIPVAGKTGTAQTGDGSDSLFVAYAPANDPQVAVAAVVEHAGEGSTAAAPVVKDLLAAYFNIPQAPQNQTAGQTQTASATTSAPAAKTTTKAAPPTNTTTAPEPGQQAAVLPPKDNTGSGSGGQTQQGGTTTTSPPKQ